MSGSGLCVAEGIGVALKTAWLSGTMTARPLSVPSRMRR